MVQDMEVVGSGLAKRFIGSEIYLPVYGKTATDSALEDGVPGQERGGAGQFLDAFSRKVRRSREHDTIDTDGGVRSEGNAYAGCLQVL
jgi:hypothetical protein